MRTTAKAFYGSRFSPNQTMTPEGFLVTHNVPISRAGWYEYLASEIGADSTSGEQIIKVFRPPDEVFSKGAIASFEGKPVCDNHPPNGVYPENAQTYSKGATQNVRRGSGDEADLLLADLIIYDKLLIDEIQSGKREVSAGYECEYEPQDDGTFVQRNIVGNHVAVVEKGRAGERVRIKDQRPVRDADDFGKQAEEASRKYGIAVKKDGHRTPPEGYPADREQYADPVNYKYPLTGEHKQAAVEYYNHPSERTKGGYTTEEWSKIGRRIVDKLGSGYELQDGKILTPEDRGRQKGADSMPNSLQPPLKNRRPVIHWLAAIGLKQFAQDAEPDKLAETVDAMVEERQEDEPEGREDAKTQDDNEDVSRIDALEKKFDSLAELVQKALAGKTSDEKSAEEVLDEAIEEAQGTADADNEEESHTIDPEDVTGDEAGPVSPPDERPKSGVNAADSAVVVAALKAIKPILANIPDAKARRQAADAAIKAIKGQAAKDSYARMATRKVQKPTKDSNAAAQQPQRPDFSDLGRQIRDKYNPHYKKQA